LAVFGVSQRVMTVPESPEMLTVTMFSLWTSIPTQVVESDMTGPSCIVALVRFAPDEPTKIHDGAGHTIMSRRTENPFG
jgi:hypothetical protein